MKEHLTPEPTARERVRAFVERLNRAPLQVALVQQLAHVREPDRYADPAIVENIPDEMYHPGAKDLALVTMIVRKLIVALEQGNQAVLSRAVEQAQDYLDSVLVTPRLTTKGGKIEVVYQDRTKGKEFLATALLLEFLTYVQNYAEEIKLGICRHCGKVFVKPKHGAQAIYCSRSCTQKEYRRRKKKKEVNLVEPHSD